MLFKNRQLQILFVCFFVSVGFLVKPILAQTPPKVTILVVDDFSGKPLGTIANPELSKEIFEYSSENDPTGSGIDLVEPLDCVEFADTDPCLQLTAAINEVANQFHDIIKDAVELEPVNFDNGLCAAHVPEFKVVEQGGHVTQLMGETPIAHGLVVQQIIETLDALGNFTVVQLPVNNFSLEATVKNINDAMLPRPDDLYVINMSFAVVACKDLPDLAAYEKYLRQSNDKGLINLEDTFAKLMMNVFQSHFETEYLLPETCLTSLKEYEGIESTIARPYLDLQFSALESKDECGIPLLNTSPKVIAVASAGNFDRKYPFWPAAWESVVAVSASSGGLDLLNADGKVASNYGEVLMPGGWNVLHDGKIDSLFGTSFAAPRLSFVMANYLDVQRSDLCRRGSAPALSYGHWDNLDLRTAVATYCKSIPIP